MTCNPRLSITDLDVVVDGFLCEWLSSKALAKGDVIFQVAPATAGRTTKNDDNDDEDDNNNNNNNHNNNNNNNNSALSRCVSRVSMTQWPLFNGSVVNDNAVNDRGVLICTASSGGSCWSSKARSLGFC